MNKSYLLIFSLIFILLSAFIVPAATAAISVTVSATVTAQNVSVTISDGTIAYGTLSTSTSQDTASGGLNDTQTATNNGNVTQDINIRGQNSGDWTLTAAAGADEYVHEFCKVDTGDCDGTATWTALTTSNQTLSSGVLASSTYDFDLKVTAPTSTSVFTQQSVDVIVQASAS